MDKDAFSIPEFCHRNSMSRGTFYNLDKIGKAPRTMRFGQKVLISKEAAADWRREREAESANKKVSDAASSEAVAA
jgi:predicted DNA-binding transcriptional regulator AlpA